jgi:hypothetical protein
MFDLDYETGDLNNAWGWYCSEYEQDDPGHSDPRILSGERLGVSSDAAAEGRLGLYTTTRSIDTVYGGARAELVLCDANKSKILLGQDDEVWYSWYTMFPSNVDFTKQKWLVWTQWHHTGPTSSPPLELAMNERNNIQYLYLQVASHYYEKQRLGQNCNLTVNSCGILWKDQLQQGKWYKINLHVIWSTCQTYVLETYLGQTIPRCDNPGKGLIEMWVDGNKVVDVSHFTLYGDKNSPYNTGVDENAVELGKQVYLKQGIYRNTDVVCTPTMFRGCVYAPYFYRDNNVYQTIFHDRMYIISSK